MNVANRTAGRAKHRGNHSISLLSKHGLVVTELARELMNNRSGEALARVQEYAQRFSASTGTIQSALNYLQAAEAVQTESRGRLGSFVRAIDYPLLWTLALGRAMVGALPLPYSKRLEGLASGVRQQIMQHALDLEFRFVRGSTRRLQLLATRECDWALVSRFAAETAGAHGFMLDTVANLGAETYLAQHILLIGARGSNGLQDGMRVGIDPQSTDHAYTVRSACRGYHVTLVDIEYSQGLKLLHAGEIDATVWSHEDLPLELENLTTVPLHASREPALGRLGEAALVVNQGDRAVTHILLATLDVDELRRVQQEVVERVRLPSY